MRIMLKKTEKKSSSYPAYVFSPSSSSVLQKWNSWLFLRYSFGPKFDPVFTIYEFERALMKTKTLEIKSNRTDSKFPFLLN